ncbi:MAG: 2-hydroxyacyl-CoA dehydratase, partial [Clostridia bacterium]|nr:2-hydroxyacyl-CoA dehydratase [Clostridia bacterium]
MNNPNTCNIPEAKSEKNYTVFTKDMMDYTILIPTMLPMHFKIMAGILKSFGYNAILLENDDSSVIEYGLKYVHNDTCYPALLVIGQMLSAIESVKYDTNKLALMITQTGGGCRASNYIFLLRKALNKAGYGHIPVISINFTGLEKESAFQLTLPLVHRLMYAVTCGDLLMNLRNQCVPYELNKGDAEKLCEKWVARLADEMQSDGKIKYKKIKEYYRDIIADFAAIPRSSEKKVKVGIVGEIFVKFSPLGNNNLEEFLVSENAEVVMPGLLDFMMYSTYNSVVDSKLLGMNKLKGFAFKLATSFFARKQKDVINAIKNEGSFDAPTPFPHVIDLADGLISKGAKMGEGWLLTAEMAELIESGVNNIVCAQPFGCLPNHIVGKGMMKPLKEKYPDSNIVAVDYDAGATKINQENRIKLML